MKTLFRQKQWMVIQVIFVFIGVIFAVTVRAGIKSPVGGLGIGLHFIADTYEYTIPIFSILLSDLVLNVEYAQGTFLTSLSCGQSRKVWMLNRSVTFYLFVLLQFFMTFAVMSLSASIITGHVGLEGLKDLDSRLYSMTALEVTRGIGLNMLRTLMFVSLAVFVTTLLPGKLIVGSITSIGTIFVMIQISMELVHGYRNSNVIALLVKEIWLEDPARSWIWGILWFALFAWLSIERVKRIEVPSRGA